MPHRDSIPDVTPAADDCLPDGILHRLTPAALHEVLHAARAEGNVAAAVQVMAVLVYRLGVDWGMWPWEDPGREVAEQQPVRREGQCDKRRRRRKPPVE